jgi:hypothetical protein
MNTGWPKGMPKRADELSTARLYVLLTPAEAADLRAQANALGTTVSDVVRRAVFGEAS